MSLRSACLRLSTPLTPVRAIVTRASLVSSSVSDVRSTTISVPSSLRCFAPGRRTYSIKKFNASESGSEMSSQDGKIVKTIPLADEDAKWVGLRAIEWIDPTGKERKWESADRKTRKGDVDAVAIMCMIHRPSSEPHLLLISQFRPPVGKSCIEMPAGLIDQGEEGTEGTNRAALRELEEETGYGTDKEGGKVRIVETTPTMHNDPGLTGANMKLCVVNIHLADDAPEPVAKPEEGEFIEKYLVPVKDLYNELKSESILDPAYLPASPLRSHHADMQLTVLSPHLAQLAHTQSSRTRDSPSMPVWLTWQSDSKSGSARWVVCRRPRNREKARERTKW
ncbi:hypothetical protein BCV70DRAFT_201375 [Testicularia cyperi]|uniref:Nudix hydrolase domain-containing protein n=1 Tax=Testicularia cyperi TaxID=1882483 RepID=A0A317XMR4_9BASI|nr:hypothetical protein BCV70DRAFT_201375 [Testicularia cyperi]